MIISIASGKGGTGKTTVAVNLALSLKDISRVQLLDCDVEEPNCCIFVKPDIEKTFPVYIPVPEVDKEICTFCGKCAKVCAYNAIAVLEKDVLVFEDLCHGCGGCSILCPRGAIKEKDKQIGVIDLGSKDGLRFIQGKLNIGQVLAPPVIRKVKKHIEREKTVIIDAPPGTSCPVVEAVKGSDFCLLVTEPTPFGLNDLTLAVEVLKQLKIPFGVVINRADMGDSGVEEYCLDNSIPVMMKIPFDKDIAVFYSKGEPFVIEMQEYKNKFIDLYDQINQSLR